jgi:2-oxoglutarate ferredoxin oxidoreductase subunit beta
VATPNDYKSDLKPIWCPGCGDFGVVQAIYRALAAIGRPPHEIAFVSGIGCSSRIPGYTTAYGFNSVHGRALPIAQGIKLARPELLVLVAGGDGDGFSIGGGHVAHAIRRNVDLTYIVMDNQIYGLTKGQLSPTSPRGLRTVSSAWGSAEDPVNPLAYVLGYGGRFVAQGTPADLNGLVALIEEGIRFPGFAFVNVQSPCVTYGRPDARARPERSAPRLRARRPLRPRTVHGRALSRSASVADLRSLDRRAPRRRRTAVPRARARRLRPALSAGPRRPPFATMCR